MKYFLVICKCGHVKKGKYVDKELPIIAKDAKEAANIARYKGRVKHHAKDAIRSVIEVTKEEFDKALIRYKSDPYFHVSSVQEQREKCPEIYDMVMAEEEPMSYRKSHERRNLVERSLLKEITKYKSYLDYE
ncbi:MAG: hypothetical protein E7175_05830 [Erysipelotrichaceae bacterium]|nr:hypothetical protein [Erysipelotrichaceae bacterium]